MKCDKIFLLDKIFFFNICTYMWSFITLFQKLPKIIWWGNVSCNITHRVLWPELGLETSTSVNLLLLFSKFEELHLFIYFRVLRWIPQVQCSPLSQIQHVNPPNTPTISWRTTSISKSSQRGESGSIKTHWSSSTSVFFSIAIRI